MADVSPTGKKKSKVASPSPAPRAEAPLLGWQAWTVIGVVLVGGVVAWKLAGSTYKSDIEAICAGETGSGFTLHADASKVTQWIRSHLSTPEGNEFFSALTDARLGERAARIRAEADKQKIRSCPIAASYEQVAAEGDYRGDLQHLCSSMSFAKLAEQGDAGRLARLEDWIDKQAKSPRTKELADPLRQAANGADRAKVLRDAASKMDVFVCEVAKTLESPPAAPKGEGSPVVRVWTEPQIVGAIKAEDLATAVAGKNDELTACYKKGRQQNGDLQGQVTVRLDVTTEGAIAKETPMEAHVADKGTLDCILAALKTMKLPKNPGPVTSILLPLELTTRADASRDPAAANAPPSPFASASPSAAPSPSTKPAH